MKRTIFNKKAIISIAILILIVLAIGVTLSSNKQKIDLANQPIDRSQIPVAVNVADVKLDSLVISNSYPAVLKPFDEVNVTTQISGIISSLVVELGQQVNKGQVLGKIDTKIAVLNLKAAEINLAKLQSDYLRAKELFENNAGTELNMLNAKSASENASVQVKLIKQQIANANITAPLSGTISAKNIKLGEFVNPGMPIATITNINSLKVTAYVDQSVVYRLKNDMVGTVTSPLLANEKLNGKIIYISPKADANHNFQIDLLLANNKISLKAGTDVFVSFNSFQKNNVLQIPKAALVTDRNEPFVFVYLNGKAVGRSIKIGTMQNDMVEILSGLQPGEKVIINGQINLKEGSNVTILN